MPAELVGPGARSDGGGGRPEPGAQGRRQLERDAGRRLYDHDRRLLPALFCDRSGTRVAAAHAGWRGLAAGVLEATVDSLGVPGDELLVWLGPAIGPQAFEVGGEVRDAFVAAHAEARSAFVPSANPGRFMADIYRLARIRLGAHGVTAVHGGGFCTFSDTARFYSYRRSSRTGRFASLVWLQD